LGIKTDGQGEINTLKRLPRIVVGARCAGAKAYFKRVTIIVSEGRMEAALYPVFPPDKAADQALAWLAENP
jgi:hypothetical protein